MFKKAVIIRQIISVHQQRKKNQSNALRPSSIFQEAFRTRNGLPQKAAVRKPVYETFKERNTSNDLGLSSSFSSSTSWQNQHRNNICVSSFCEPHTLSDYLYFPLFVVFLFLNMVYIIVRTHRLVLSDRSRKCLDVKSLYVPLTFTHPKCCAAKWG